MAWNQDASLKIKTHVVRDKEQIARFSAFNIFKISIQLLRS